MPMAGNGQIGTFAQIPMLDEPTCNAGVGSGTYDGRSALAVGAASAPIDKAKATVATAFAVRFFVDM
ncbi:YadA-like family protein [Antrihabitans stalactiti]|uniref:YadA-like family protein n=1 Tax=Antrihabitans stalactiti TaxID=2584121 RepID=UPI00146A430F